jgi:hypothetical protein
MNAISALKWLAITAVIAIPVALSVASQLPIPAFF